MVARAARVFVSEERVVGAPADVVYQVIADYREHHPAILPSAFSDFVVEQGGVGEGTEISYTLRFGGRARRSRARVTEPIPGRVLVETALERDVATSFVVTGEGDISKVRIETEFPPAGGLQGWIERRFAPGMLRKLYVEELEKLDEYARRRVA